MQNEKVQKSLLLFFGITLFTQAVTSLVGGSIFMSPFESGNITGEVLKSIYEKVAVGNASIVLQIITAVVIILLGIAMYKMAGYKQKTIAIIALCMYVFEAVLLTISQGFVFGLIEISKQYVSSGDTYFVTLGGLLSSIEDFIGKIAMIPFGIGAVLFYLIITKANVIPKWLGWYGIITVPLILIFTPLMAFGIDIPFWLLVPYVPFEFFTGAFVTVKAVRKMKS